MNPGRIITRSGLVEKLHGLCPSRACQKAMQAGRIAVIGGFSNIPPFGLPGWICCVRSVHGRTWLLALCVDEIEHRYLCRRPDKIPWDLWVGRANGDTWNAYDGDEPHISACNSGCDCGSLVVQGSVEESDDEGGG